MQAVICTAVISVHLGNLFQLSVHLCHMSAIESLRTSILEVLVAHLAKAEFLGRLYLTQVMQRRPVTTSRR